MRLPSQTSLVSSLFQDHARSLGRILVLLGGLVLLSGLTPQAWPGVSSLAQKGSPSAEGLFGPVQVQPAVSADRLEVTQAVQDLRNSVRLVQGKRTFVRLHVHGDPAAAPVDALLHAVQGSAEIWLRPLNAGRVTLLAAPDRGVLDHSFLFELPNAFTQGSVTLTGHVNVGAASRGIQERVSSISTTVAFETVPTLHLVLYRLGYRLEGVDYWASPQGRNQVVDWLQRVYPVGDLRVWDRTLWLGEATVNQNGAMVNPTCGSVNALLVSKKIWDTSYGVAAIPLDAQYYGLVDDGGGFMQGCSLGDPFFVSSGPTGSDSWGWDKDGSYGDWYASHGMAAAFGLPQDDVCNIAGSAPIPGSADVGADPVYPYPQGRISPQLTGESALYGFDVASRSIYSPAYKDLMTYCGYQWISDFTYERLMDTLQKGTLTTATASQAAGRATNPVDRLLITGAIDPYTSSVYLKPFFIIPGAGDIFPRQPGPYTILLKDSQGQVLATYPFTPRPSSGGAGGVGPSAAGDQGEAAAERLVIAELVPYVAGTSRVDILAPDSAAMAGVTANPGQPQVQVTYPSGGEIFGGSTLSVYWTASDADGDPLAFNVQYSPDNGQSWEMVAQGIAGNSTDINLADLTSTQNGRFRVWVSDGIHTNFGESAPFVIPNRAPQVRIHTPGPALTVAVSQTVTLAGSAYDLDSGPLTGPDMRWSSDLDGDLGVGPLLSLANLTPGLHTITLRAADAQGVSAMATVRVTVVGTPGEAPLGSDALTVGPAFLAPTIQDPINSRHLFVSNRNFTRSVNWTARSDQPWLVLEKSSGVTPDIIPVSVNWTSVNWTSVNWTSVNWTSVNWTSVNWTGGLPSGQLLAGVIVSSPDLSQAVLVPVEVTVDALYLFLPSLSQE